MVYVRSVPKSDRQGALHERCAPLLAEGKILDEFLTRRGVIGVRVTLNGISRLMASFCCAEPAAQVQNLVRCLRSLPTLPKDQADASTSLDLRNVIYRALHAGSAAKLQLRQPCLMEDSPEGGRE